MKRVVTVPQGSDMGEGFGYIEGATGCTLKEVLDFYAKNSKTWGAICIRRNGAIIRKFDYDTFNNNIFYHHLTGWDYESIVKEAKFRYCFMSEDVEIYLD